MPVSAYKRCPRCKQDKPADTENFGRSATQKDGLQSYCRPCQVDAHREWRERNRAHMREVKRKARAANPEKEAERRERDRRLHPERWKARQAVYKAIRSGKLIRPSICSRCAKPGRIEAHHHDYTKPLVVEWVCVVCHQRDHAEAA